MIVITRWKRCARLLLAVAVAILFSISVETPAQLARPPQSPPLQYSPQLVSEIKNVQQAAFESDYAYRQLAHLSNNIGPRLSGSPQAQTAVEYVAAELRKLGLEVQLEKVMVPHWVRGEETGALTEYPGMSPGTTQKIVLTALGGSVATSNEGLTAEVVVVNNFDELTALGRERVAGKIVLFNAKFDQQLADNGFAGPAYGQSVIYRGIGASAAARLGALAALNRSAGGADYRLPHTGALRYADDAPKIPAAAVTAEDAETIAHLAREGKVRMHLVLTPQTLPDAVSYNVIADLKGSEHPEQIVIASGHLDSWDLGRGAIDDGAGVVIAMQTAQLLKQLNLRPQRTIRIIAWMNEENGARGGRTYAEDHKADFANHFAAIESDLGAGHPLGFYAQGKPELLTLMQPLSTILQSQGAGVTRMVDETGTDVAPLGEAGVPTFAPIQDARTYFNYHHTAADTLDKVNPRELQENCALVAALPYTLASMPQPLPR
ncbi:MAG TPA: M20/M25/M40 family metallo-hydrolase [Pyrinomonadaceae bacterium]|nr:M20/M25/M40 family metallo-hydrolase [Pyrinomonadaceae bacterium]